MYQKLTLIGNLGRDPELRATPDGRAVTTLNVATNRAYKDGNGQQVKQTTWFRVSVFGKQAEACAQYLQKGRLVLLEGRLQPDKNTGSPRIWEKQDGTPAASFEVFATEVKFLPSGGGNGGNGNGQHAPHDSHSDDDLPAPEMEGFGDDEEGIPL